MTQSHSIVLFFSRTAFYAAQTNVSVFRKAMRFLQFLHQSAAASTSWCGFRPHLGWVKKTVGFPEGPSYPGHSLHTNHFFAVLPLNDRRRALRSLFEIGHLFSLPFAHLLILLLLLMSSNIHSNLGLSFPVQCVLEM